MAKFKLNSPHYRGDAYLRAGEEITIQEGDHLPPKDSTPLDDEATAMVAAAKAARAPVTCASCGAPVGTAKFCPECGKPVQPKGDAKPAAKGDAKPDPKK